MPFRRQDNDAIALGSLRKEMRVDLAEYMTGKAIAELVVYLRRTGNDMAQALASQVNVARTEASGRVIVTGASLDKMLNALPRGPAAAHTRKTIAHVISERNKRAKAIHTSRTHPRSDLLTNPAADGRNRRARRRSGPFYPN
jgi:hypothetical protein